MLAQLSLTEHPSHLSSLRFTPLLSGVLANLGLFFMSATNEYPDSATWSSILWRIGPTIFPAAATREVHKSWGSIGAIFLIMGIIFSPHARQLLSAKPLTWLGSVSFPVFLLHPLFMQIVMPLFAFSSEYFMVQLEVKIDEDTGSQTFLEVPRFKQRGVGMIGVAVVVTLACTIGVSHLWMLKVEPMFGRITKWCEGIMTGRQEIDWSLPRLNISRLTISTTSGSPRVLDETLASKEGHVA